MSHLTMNRFEELCSYYVAFLRSIYLCHQGHHWITKGNDFYGNHLLFERIYKTAADDADLAAEKFIGLFGNETLDPHMQAQLIGRILENFSDGDPIETSLRIEKKFLNLSEKFYRMIKEEGGRMTLGLDDMLMSIASNREGAVYLLKQAAGKEIIKSENMKISARVKLLERIKNAQTFDLNAFQQKLQTQWNAMIISYVQGTYNEKDLSVYIDTKNQPPRILANAKLPTAISVDLQKKIEDQFKAFVINLLPDNMKNSFIVAVGFSMPPIKPLPARK